MINILSMHNTAPVHSMLRPSDNYSYKDFERLGPSESRGRLSSFTDEEAIASNGETIDTFDSQLMLEDMESILEGVTAEAPVATTDAIPGDFGICINSARYCLNGSRSGNDLTVLMSNSERHRLATSVSRHSNNDRPFRATSMKQFGRLGLKERMEDYLEQGLTRILRETDSFTIDEKGGPSKSSQSLTNVQNEKNMNHRSFPSATLVWTIQPTIRNGKPRFRFSTDFGARFTLNKRDSLEFIELTKGTSEKYSGASHGCNTFYQVYTMDRKESRVVNYNAVTSLLEEMTKVMVSKLSPFTHVESRTIMGHTNVVYDGNRKNEQNIDIPGTTKNCSPAKTHNDNGSKKGDTMKPKSSYKRSPAKRLLRFLNRRRMKRSVRQQTYIALKKTKGLKPGKKPSSTSSSSSKYLTFQNR